MSTKVMENSDPPVMIKLSESSIASFIAFPYDKNVYTCAIRKLQNRS